MTDLKAQFEAWYSEHLLGKGFSLNGHFAPAEQPSYKWTYSHPWTERCSVAFQAGHDLKDKMNLKSPDVSLSVGHDEYHVPVFEWLDKVSKQTDDPEIRQACEVLKDYYQGVSPAESRALKP